MKHLLLLLGLALLTGCAATPKPAQVDFADARPPQANGPAADRVPTGSLFQQASYRPRFEDQIGRASWRERV